MSLLDRVRGRLSGFSQADVDPHEWRLPSSPSSTTRFSTFSAPPPPPPNTLKSSDVSSSSRNELLIPDPAIFRNAFVPSDPAQAVADGRLTYPDASHGAVHLALLECFGNLRRSVCRALPEDVGDHLPPAYDEHPHPYHHRDDSDNDSDAGDADVDDDDDTRSDDGYEKKSAAGSPVAATEAGRGGGGGGRQKKRQSHRRRQSETDEVVTEVREEDDAESQRRWDLLVRLAVTRFGAWWANIDKLLDHATAYTPAYHHYRSPSAPSPPYSRSYPQPQRETAAAAVIQLTPDYLPPLDVLLVWYAFMLAPPTSPFSTFSTTSTTATTDPGNAAPPPSFSSPYDSACRDHRHPALQHVCFPWPAIREVISFPSTSSSKDGAEYRLPGPAATLFRTLSDQPADVLEYLEMPPAYTPDNHDHHHDGAGAAVLAATAAASGEGVVGGVDLFAAVKAQVEPFARRARELDWLRAPPRTLAGALARADQAYREFLLRGGEQTGLWEEEDGSSGGQQQQQEDHEHECGGEDGDGGEGEGRGRGRERRSRRRRQLPFGVSLMWRSHRLFPAQYRIFCEGDALAALRRAALGPGAGWKKLDALGDSRDGHICECWTCERIRDEAPEWSYDRAVPQVAGRYDASILRALSTDQLRSIQEDLGLCHAIKNPSRKRKKRRRRRRRGSSSSRSSSSSLSLSSPTARSPTQKISAGRIFSMGIKAVEDRRRSWRLD